MKTTLSRRLLPLLVLAATALACLPALAAAAPGDLDPTFDGDGRATLDVLSGDFGFGAALDPDGKILIAGDVDFPVDRTVGLARLAPNGAPDAQFGGGAGFVTSNPTVAVSDFTENVQLQPDGKILVGGEIKRGANGLDWTVARFNPDGSFDNSFDNDGRLATPFTGNDFLYDMVVQPDGKIVAVGVRSAATADIVLARYLPDGSLDKTFSGNGKQAIDLGGDEIGRGLVLQPDGKLVVSGQTDAANGDDDMVVSRLDAAGELDPGFGVNGTRFVDFNGGNDEAHDLLLQPDGKLVATGWAVVPGTVDFAAIRLEGDPPAGAPAAPGKPQGGVADGAVTIRILGRALRLNRRGIGRLRLHCPKAEQSGPCRGRAAIRTPRLRLGKGRRGKRVVIGRAGFRIAAGRTKAVKVRVGGRKLRLLKRSRRARRVVAIARVRDGAGNRGTVRKRMRAVPGMAKRQGRR